MFGVDGVMFLSMALRIVLRFREGDLGGFTCLTQTVAELLLHGLESPRRHWRHVKIRTYLGTAPEIVLAPRTVPLSREGRRRKDIYEKGFVKRDRRGFCDTGLSRIPLARDLGRSGPSQTGPRPMTRLCNPQHVL